MPIAMVLCLLTDLGELTLKLTHPRYSHAKTYRVWVQGCATGASPRSLASGCASWMGA